MQISMGRCSWMRPYGLARMFALKVVWPPCIPLALKTRAPVHAHAHAHAHAQSTLKFTCMYMHMYMYMYMYVYVYISMPTIIHSRRTCTLQQINSQVDSPLHMYVGTCATPLNSHVL